MAIRLTVEDFEVDDSVQITKHEKYKDAIAVVAGKTTSYITVTIDKSSIFTPENASIYYLENEHPNLLIEPCNVKKV